MAPRNDTRERMVNAAHDLFAERGYGRLTERTPGGGVTMLEIVERAGASRGAIYHHFPNGKHDLAVAVADRVGRDAVSRIAAAAANTDSAEAFLRAVLEHHGELVEALGYRVGCPLVGIEVNADTAELDVALNQAFATWTGAIADGLRSKGVAAKRARQLATATLAAIEGGLAMSRATGSNATFSHLIAALPNLLASQ